MTEEGKMNEIPLEDIDEAASDRALDRVAREMGLVDGAEAPESKPKDPKKRKSLRRWAEKTK